MVVFTCFVTRAVHLEIVLSDEVEGFLMALKQMISARGRPQLIEPDRAFSGRFPWCSRVRPSGFGTSELVEKVKGTSSKKRLRRTVFLA